MYKWTCPDGLRVKKTVSEHTEELVETNLSLFSTTESNLAKYFAETLKKGLLKMAAEECFEQVASFQCHNLLNNYKNYPLVRKTASFDIFWIVYLNLRAFLHFTTVEKSLQLVSVRTNSVGLRLTVTTMWPTCVAAVLTQGAIGVRRTR